MSKNISQFDLSNPKKQRGRDRCIEDDRLWGTREHLVWLMEVSWDTMGHVLGTIESPDEVEPSLQAWKGRSSEYVVNVLLRPSAIHATSKQLNGQRRALKVLNKKVRATYEFMEKCDESLERAMRIPTTHLPQSEQMFVDDRIRERAAALAHAGWEYLALRDQREILEKLLNDGEAHFARTEFVTFCKSGRYSLTPLNTANALAGLPFIGWRQSAKRCKKWEKSAAAKGISYQVFETIRRIVSSNDSLPELVRDAELWLRGRRSTERAPTP